MKCSKCGKEIETNYVACPFCGTKTKQQQVSSQKNVSLSNIDSAIGFLMIFAGIIFAIISLWLLVSAGSSRVADSFNFGTSFILIVFLACIIGSGVYMVLTGLHILAEGIGRYKIRAFGIAIMSVGIILFFLKAFILGAVMMVVGLLISKVLL